MHFKNTTVHAQPGVCIRCELRPGKVNYRALGKVCWRCAEEIAEANTQPAKVKAGRAQ
jgi:hypothetical protein